MTALTHKAGGVYQNQAMAPAARLLNQRATQHYGPIEEQEVLQLSAALGKDRAVGVEGVAELLDELTGSPQAARE